MPRSTASNRPGRPPATSRQAIAAGALRLIDRDGWQKLTVRRLAAELGVGATTLYHHVRNREDLLILLINEQARNVTRPDLSGPPRARIITAATTMHDFLSEWPWATEVLTTDGFIGRLEESSLWMVEAILDAAVECGCSRDRAVDLFRHLWYYTAGELLVRAHSRHRPQDDPATRAAFFTPEDMSALPRLADLGHDWPRLTVRDIYPNGLEAFVDGLLAQAGDVRAD